jgi:hypothetical protein
MSAPVLVTQELTGIDSPVAPGSLRRAEHLRDRGEIAVRANLTIKYEFILRSDLPEFACRAGCLTCLLELTITHRGGYPASMIVSAPRF